MNFRCSSETSIHYLSLVNVKVSARLTHTVVTQAAVGGARRPEHLAGEAVLELHHLLVDEDFLGSWWRPIAGVSSVVYRREDSKEKQQPKIYFTDQQIFSDGGLMFYEQKPPFF